MTTTSDTRVLFDVAAAQQAARIGLQRPLICIAAPAAMSAVVGTDLLGKTLTANGDYVCLIPIAGLTTVKVHVRATLTGVGVALTSAGPDELARLDPRTDSVEAALVVGAGAGDGALTTDTTQTATLSRTGGLYARYTLTLASAGTAAITVADVDGV